MKALDTFTNAVPAIPCFGHTLQLAFNDGINATENLRNVLRVGNKIVQHYHRSNTALGNLFSNQKWCQKRAFVNILAPFNDAIVISFGEKYVTLSTIIPMLHGLTTALQNYASIDADDFSDQFRRKLQGSLNNRFHNKYHQIKFHLPAMVVDHRFKDVLLSENQSVGARNSPMQYLEDIGPCDTVNITESNGEEIASTASTVWDAFDEAARRKARKIAFPKQTVMQTK